MKRDALPLLDQPFSTGAIRLCDLPPDEFMALRSALDAAARRERARVADQWLKIASRGLQRLFRRDEQRSVAVRPTHPRAQGCG